MGGPVQDDPSPRGGADGGLPGSAVLALEDGGHVADGGEGERAGVNAVVFRGGLCWCRRRVEPLRLDDFLESLHVALVLETETAELGPEIIE